MHTNSHVYSQDGATHEYKVLHCISMMSTINQKMHGRGLHFLSALKLANNSKLTAVNNNLRTKIETRCCI